MLFSLDPFATKGKLKLPSAVHVARNDDGTTDLKAPRDWIDWMAGSLQPKDEDCCSYGIASSFVSLLLAHHSFVRHRGSYMDISRVSVVLSKVGDISLTDLLCDSACWPRD